MSATQYAWIRLMDRMMHKLREDVIINTGVTDRSARLCSIEKELARSRSACVGLSVNLGD